MRRVGGFAGLFLLFFIISVGISGGDARANKDDALKLLKAMSDYVSQQKTISAAFEASIEVVTHELE